jgi:hypothetical protein
MCIKIKLKLHGNVAFKSLDEQRVQDFLLYLEDRKYGVKYKLLSGTSNTVKYHHNATIGVQKN